MSSQSFFFQNWQGVFHAVIVGGLAFVALVVLLRVMGKKMLLKTSAASFVKTVALGNALATIILTESLALSEGMAAFLTFMSVQFALLWVSSRSATVQQLLPGDPALVFVGGHFRQGAMRTNGVSTEDIYAAMRQHGFAERDQVGAVVYETDGTMSLLKRSADGRYPSLRGIPGYQAGLSTQRRSSSTRRNPTGEW